MRELEELKQLGLVATSDASGLLERLKQGYLSQNTFPFPLMIGCCALEMKQVSELKAIPHPEESDGPGEEQSDLFIVSGHINLKWAPILLKAFQAMSSPKYVMAVGTCASSGAIFEGHTGLKGLDSLIPVDVYIPGCPPTPHDIICGLEEINKRIAAGVYSTRGAQ